MSRNICRNSILKYYVLSRISCSHDKYSHPELREISKLDFKFRGTNFTFQGIHTKTSYEFWSPHRLSETLQKLSCRAKPYRESFSPKISNNQIMKSTCRRSFTKSHMLKYLLTFSCFLSAQIPGDHCQMRWKSSRRRLSSDNIHNEKMCMNTHYLPVQDNNVMLAESIFYPLYVT